MLLGERKGRIMTPFGLLKRAIALCTATFGLFATVIFVSPSSGAAQGLSLDLQGWVVEGFQPPIRPGGRANTIAVHPNGSVTLVASESGGLFQSTDGGNKWQHVDSLPVFYTNAVAFAKDNVVIVTATEDFSVSNRGGIWRSENGGKSWAQVTSPSAPSGVTLRFSAYEISIAPDTGNIYVATSFGVSIGDPEGKTWTHVDPFGFVFGNAGDRRVISVLALPKNLVLAGGPAGIVRSTDGGTTWVGTTALGLAIADWVIGDMHAFGRSPAANDQAYVVAPAKLDDAKQKFAGLLKDPFNAACKDTECQYMVLYRTTDGGDTWKGQFIAPLNTCRPKGGCCGGIGFVKAIGKGTSFDLYVSNRCIVWKLPHGATTWETLIRWDFDPSLKTSEVGDTRDLAFNTKNEPILVASDGGLARPPSVVDVQMALKALKDAGGAAYYFGAISGSFDAGTQKALTKYQSDHGLTPSGTIDQPTIKSLGLLWTLVGDEGLVKGNGPNGYNALQIYEVKGQWIGNYVHNLYFGTQDNGLWSSSDTGTTWQSCCNEGGFIEAENHVPSESDSQITFSTNPPPGGVNRKLLGLLFGGAKVVDWKLTNCEDCGHPKIIRKNFHVQGVNLVLGPAQPQPGHPNVWIPKIIWLKGLARTPDFGLNWEPYANFDDDRRDLPKVSAPPTQMPVPGQKTAPVLYQAIRTGFDWNKAEIIQLARILKKPSDPKASVTTPTSTKGYMTGFGGIGLSGNGDYCVFGVDPGDKNHVIAADTFSEQMMETTDGGYNWTAMPLLTSLVKDGGKLNFSGRIFSSQYPNSWYAQASPVTQASVISFCPDNPNVVAVGTVQNGIFISADHGKDGTWKEAHGSKRATLISSLHWRKPDDIIVSSYGRGLWRVKFKYLINLLGLPCRSPNCIDFYIPPPGPTVAPQPTNPYDQVLVAFGGAIEGARITNGIVQEVYVRPATTVAFGTDLKQVPQIKVTETTEPVRFQGIRSVPRPPAEARIITGLTLKKRGERSKLVGFQFSPRPRSMYTPEERPEAEERPVGPPAEQKAYLEVLSTSVGPGSTIQLSGRGLSPEIRIEIAVDGNTVQKLATDREGKFSSALQAPTQFGSHSLTLIDSVSRKILDGAMISVTPIDRSRSR